MLTKAMLRPGFALPISTLFCGFDEGQQKRTQMAELRSKVAGSHFPSEVFSFGLLLGEVLEVNFSLTRQMRESRLYGLWVRDGLWRVDNGIHRHSCASAVAISLYFGWWAIRK